jgi:WD40 repeat protein
MDNRTCILAGALTMAVLGGLACGGARFSLVGGRQDGGAGTGGAAGSGGVGPGGSTNADGGAETAAMGGTPEGAGGVAGQGGQGGQGGQAGQAGLAKFVPVDPKISRLWRWQACGAIPPTTASAVQAIFPPAGDALAVLYDDGRVLLHPRQEGAAPKVLRPTGGPPTSIAFSLDGTNLAEVAAGVVRLRDVATGSTLRNMKVNSSCAGDAVRFSAEGTYVLAWDQKSLCVWQTSDGTFVSQLAGNFSSVGMTSGRILTAELGSPPSVKTWSLTGLVQTQVTLEVPAGEELTDSTAPPGQGGLQISPRGDTFAGVLSDNATLVDETFATLWSADGKLLGSFRIPDPVVGNAPACAYSESGALALLGNEVVDVASSQHWTNTAVDRELYASIDETGMLVAGLSSIDDLHVAAATGENGNPTARRLFGSLPQPPDTQSSMQTVLSISPDGSRLATASPNPPSSLLWRVAADFSASVPVRSVGQGIPLEVSFSASTPEVVFSGDGWGIVSADDGAYLDGVAPPPDVPSTGCWFSTARFSSSGRWLAVGKLGAQMSLLARSDLHEITVLPIAHCQSRGSFNRDDSLVAMSGPEVYRTSDWSLVWPAQIIAETPPPNLDTVQDFFRDAQFAPGDQALLVSRCDVPAGGVTGCAHELRAVSDGALIQELPEITGTRARFSGEGNWIVSGNTALHVPTSETVVFAPTADLSTFAPNGDIIAVLHDGTLARYCRTP